MRQKLRGFKRHFELYWDATRTERELCVTRSKNGKAERLLWPVRFLIVEAGFWWHRFVCSAFGHSWKVSETRERGLDCFCCSRCGWRVGF